MTPRETAEQIVEKWWIDPVAPDASLDELKSAIEAALLAERDSITKDRKEVIMAFRALCNDFGLDNSWPDDLHAADIIEKYVARSLTAIRSNEG